MRFVLESFIACSSIGSSNVCTGEAVAFWAEFYWGMEHKVCGLRHAL